MKLYHISRDPNLKTMTPRVPRNYYTKVGWENGSVGRVCFAPSISNCLSAIPVTTGELLYVYVAVSPNPAKIYKPSKKEVIDAEYTNEIWYLGTINVKKIATIIVGDTYLWNQFDNRDYRLQYSKFRYKKFKGVPTKEEREKYLNTQEGYLQENYYRKQNKFKLINTALAASAGTAVLMLIGNKLINIKKQ